MSQNSVVVAVFYTPKLNFAEDLQHTHTHTHTRENNENFLDVGVGASLSFPILSVFLCFLGSDVGVGSLENMLLSIVAS